MSAIRSSRVRIDGDVRVVDGTPPSFEVFFENERIRLYGVLFAITGSRQEAEDISQEAFLRVWERWDRVAGLDEPVGYLHRIAMNVFRDRRRRLVLGLKRALRPPAARDELEVVETRSVASWPLDGQSAEDWFWAGDQVCETGGNYGRFTVDGEEASYRGCDGHANRFENMVVQVATATHFYVIYLHVADDPDLQDTYTEGWFDAVLDTVELR